MPQFGGYAPGLTMGLAFLSDIQVFLFLEAAQGDVRANVMQAPKLTLFNGQTATLNVFDQQSFVTGVQVAQVARETITAKVSANGKIQTVKKVDISANIMGQVTRLAVKEGDAVAAGGPSSLTPSALPV